MTDTETTALEKRTPNRALVIAAIHAYAEWLTEHPEIPAPTHLSGWSHEHLSTEQARERITELDQTDMQLEKEPGPESTLFRIAVMAEGEPLEIEHRAAVHLRTPWENRRSWL
jgi:hypothetical protein